MKPRLLRDEQRPTIGILSTLSDYALLAPALAAEGRTLLLDERGALSAVKGEAIDLLIMAARNDWWSELPGLQELEAEIVKAGATVMAVVPRGDTAALAHAFDHGVADCIVYPFDIDEVVVRVRVRLQRKRLDDERRAEAAEVRRLALTDPVTGLWNRHYLDTELAAAVEQGKASGKPLSLMMIDIDRFKPINDRHGHAVGDKVLRSVGSRLVAGIRSGDALARYGGDELALVMPNTMIAAASLVAERLRHLIAEGTTEVAFGVTISIGVAELLSDEPAAVLLARADKALYMAKFGGRNRVAAAS